MRESLVGVEYEALGTDAYLADFWLRFEHIGDVLWKLERGQDFREPGYPSWDAFAAGRVEESLALAEGGRAELVKYHGDLAERGVVSRRVRIVADPPTPYLWWESHILKMRAETGEQIQTVDATAVADYEKDGWTLPEMVGLGSEVVYAVRYDAVGVLTGAYRYQQPALVKLWLGFVNRLFDAGEPFLDYYRRVIEPRASAQLRKE
jgi:hypothetical protein